MIQLQRKATDLVRITRITAYSLRLPESLSSMSGTPAGAAPPSAGGYFTVANSPNLFSRSLEAALVRIETEDGLAGWGEAQAPVGAEVVATAIDRLLRPTLLGADALETRVLWRRMYDSMRARGHTTGFMLDAIAAVDNALWDWKGKRLGLPVHALMGGAFRRELPAYVSGVAGSSPGEIAANAAARVEEGFGAIKLFLGRGYAADVAVAEAVRDAIGERPALLIDVQWRYEVPEAIRLGRALERLDARWLETPVAPEDLAGAAEVARALDVPVALGECERTPWQFRDLLAARAADIVQPDLGRCGGLTGFQEIAALAAAHHIPVAVHCGIGFGLYLAAGLHALATQPGEMPMELMPAMLETANRFLREPLRLQAGTLTVPEGPGLGVELDEAALQPYLRPAAA
jgi:galactonate dehydratase